MAPLQKKNSLYNLLPGSTSSPDVLMHEEDRRSPMTIYDPRNTREAILSSTSAREDPRPRRKSLFADEIADFVASRLIERLNTNVDLPNAIPPPIHPSPSDNSDSEFDSAYESDEAVPGPKGMQRKLSFHA